MPKNNPHDRQYIVECIAMGRYVKVTAIDPNSGIEVSMMGDAKAPQAHLNQLAVRKLEKHLLEIKMAKSV